MEQSYARPFVFRQPESLSNSTNIATAQLHNSVKMGISDTTSPQPSCLPPFQHKGAVTMQARQCVPHCTPIQRHRAISAIHPVAIFRWVLVSGANFELLLSLIDASRFNIAAINSFPCPQQYTPIIRGFAAIVCCCCPPPPIINTIWRVEIGKWWKSENFHDVIDQHLTLMMPLPLPSQAPNHTLPKSADLLSLCAAGAILHSNRWAISTPNWVIWTKISLIICFGHDIDYWGSKECIPSSIQLFLSIFGDGGCNIRGAGSLFAGDVKFGMWNATQTPS